MTSISDSMYFIFLPIVAFILNMFIIGLFGEFVEVNKNGFDEYLVTIQVLLIILVFHKLKNWINNQ